MPAPSELDALIDQAAALREAGRVPEAIAAYERLLALEPALPNCWYNLARLLRQARRPHHALAAYEQALAQGISGPEEVHLNRGVIYADDLRRDADAERELQRALACNPRYVPALMNLGNLHEDRGDREAARTQYARALAIEPAAFDALARFANLADVGAETDPLVGRLRAARASPQCTAAERAHLGFALGRLLDGCGAYDAAFDAYAQANADSRASARPPVRHDRAADAALVDALIAAFPARRDGASAVDGREPPLFICGMFRSGSTLAEQVLASHPDVQSGGELDLLPALVREHLAPYPAAAAAIEPATAQRLAGDYLAALARLFPGAHRVTDKLPDNYLHIGLIKTLFPGAKIVHTVRQPLDNCLSVYFLHLAHSRSYALDLLDTGHHYLQYRRLMAHWRALYGDDILDFDYDAFVRAPREQAARLLHFCGLPWDERCLQFHTLRNVVKTASVWQVRQPLNDRSSGRWRHYRRHLQPLAQLLGEALQTS